MRHARWALVLLIAFLVPTVLAACGGSAQPPAEEPQEPPQSEEMEEPEEEMEEPEEEMEEPMSALEGDPTGQTITFWHAMSSGANLEGMTALIDQFNAENEWDITVEAVAQGSQGDLETAVNGAIATGELPNLTMGFPNGLVRWYGLDVIAGLNDFIEDPMYGLTEEELAAIYPGPYSSGTLPDGTQVGIPMHQSAQVNFYNYTWAQELGFDGPPTTSAEFKEQVCAAAEANNNDDNPDNDGTGGYVYFPGASTVAPWIWSFGGDLLNEDGDAYVLNSQEAIDVAMFFRDLAEDGCIIFTPSFPNPEFANRLTLVATSSTAGVPFQAAAMEEAGNDDEWGAIPFVGPDGNPHVNAFGQMIGIVRTNADQDLASWLFLRWLTSAETQSDWLGYTGYFPSQTTTDVGSRPEEDEIWAEALALLESAKAEPNLAAHGAVRGEIQDAYFAILEAETEEDVIAILDELDQTAADLVAETQ